MKTLVEYMNETLENTLQMEIAEIMDKEQKELITPEENQEENSEN